MIRIKVIINKLLPKKLAQLVGSANKSGEVVVKDARLEMLLATQGVELDDILKIVIYHTPLGEVWVVEVKGIEMYFPGVKPDEKGENIIYPQQYVAEIVSGAGKGTFLSTAQETEGGSGNPIYSEEVALTTVLKDAADKIGNDCYDQGGEIYGFRGNDFLLKL
ncbi:MAG: hypothetical protein IBX55_00480 [Methyloprofundus sp.]|nr:hypothetical protein [Methyloprofundus sp.]